MTCERSKLSMLLRCWKRRIGSRLDASLRARDPVEEINSHLLPNDHHEARSAFWRDLVTSYRSLVWPFTPLLPIPARGLRLPTGGV